MKKILYIILSALAFAPSFAQAATLSFDPTEKAANPGDIIVVPIRLSVPAGECVNVATVDLSFAPSDLSVQTIGRGGSIFPLWLDEKTDNTLGSAHFTVGIPGGYCGAVAGDIGTADTVAKIAFQYKATSPTTVTFGSSTAVALANGSGDLASIETKPLTIIPAKGQTVKNEWLSEVANDRFAPEQFTPEVMKDTTNEHSPFYLVFSTTDKQSGIDRYTVREEDPRYFGFHIGTSVRSEDIPSVSPYQLQDQTLRSRIVVHAYDKAGNMTESILPPTNERPTFEASDLGMLVFFGGGLGAFVVIIMWSMRKIFWRKYMLVEDENELH